MQDAIRLGQIIYQRFSTHVAGHEEKLVIIQSLENEIKMRAPMLGLHADVRWDMLKVVRGVNTPHGRITFSLPPPRSGFSLV